MKKLLLITLSFLSFSILASAQPVNKDSLSLVSKIAADQAKLTKLQNSVDEKTKEKQRTAEQAQASADDNRTAANRLSNDPQDQKLAKRADQKASTAKSDARKARNADDELEDLNKDIRNLTEKIAKEKTKLNKYVLNAQAADGPAAAPVTPAKD